MPVVASARSRAGCLVERPFCLSPSLHTRLSSAILESLSRRFSDEDKDLRLSSHNIIKKAIPHYLCAQACKFQIRSGIRYGRDTWAPKVFDFRSSTSFFSVFAFRLCQALVSPCNMKLLFLRSRGQVRKTPLPEAASIGKRASGEWKDRHYLLTGRALGGTESASGRCQRLEKKRRNYLDMPRICSVDYV